MPCSLLVIGSTTTIFRISQYSSTHFLFCTSFFLFSRGCQAFHIIIYTPEYIPGVMLYRIYLLNIVNQHSFLIISLTRRRFLPSATFWTSSGHRCRPFFPPGTCLESSSRIGFSIPTDRRFSFNVAINNSRSRAFRWSVFMQEKVPTSTRWETNSRNWLTCVLKHYNLIYTWYIYTWYMRTRKYFIRSIWYRTYWNILILNTPGTYIRGIYVQKHTWYPGIIRGMIFSWYQVCMQQTYKVCVKVVQVLRG